MSPVPGLEYFGSNSDRYGIILAENVGFSMNLVLRNLFKESLSFIFI